MEEYFTRIWNDLLARIGGPLSMRLWLQPTMAIIFAIRDGLKDAKAGRSFYFYALFTEPDNRRSLLREGLKSVAKIFVLAIVLDTVYQLIVFHWLYPVETLIVAFCLALLPYLLLRGTANRVARLWQGGKAR
jgi:hypothetical protein